MDMQIIEHHPQRVRDALRRGEFDAVEIVGEADEREFFELLFREKLLEAWPPQCPPHAARRRYRGGSFWRPT